jgi:hypothetical protein
MVWMFIISILLISYILTIYSDDNKFYRFGPQPDLIILGFTIDTPEKYSLIVLYAIINTIIRNLDHNILFPWITLNVQNMNAQNTEINKISHKFEISITNTVYSWFDWLIYIHMLLAQIDMFLLELTTDVIAIYFVTRWYIKNKTLINDTVITPTEKKNETRLL